MRVSGFARGTEDGYHSPLVPGLKSSADAERLADEIGLAVHRLSRLKEDPPGLYAEVADPGGEIEERAWLAFQIAYFCPLDGDDPFAGIRAARTGWASGRSPRLEGIAIGPRSAHDPRGRSHARRLPYVGGARRLSVRGVHGRRRVDG